MKPKPPRSDDEFVWTESAKIRRTEVGFDRKRGGCKEQLYGRLARPADVDRNVGGFDRIGRTILAVALLLIGYRNRNRTLGTLAFVAGSDVLATAVIQRCPVNALLGIDTCGTDQ